ncbi:MAG: hypothetical protein IT271_14680 [Chitinophagales bacterium]|jgi:hypothetical protein|nr:hypothetical protein [Chitinophagales bacterium]
MSDLKIAFVKQEVYQDLYVCSNEEKSAGNILFSSIMRVGPIGLMAENNADFYILSEEYNEETQVYKRVIPRVADKLQLLKTQTFDTLEGVGFFSPGSPYPNGKFAVDGKLIDWSIYDVVISINISIPTEIIKKYSDTLFCYMIGEANILSQKVEYGYDAVLNQNASGKLNIRKGVVDFPYTFLKGNTLEDLLSKRFKNRNKRGIYVEINSCKERPVVSIPDDFKIIMQRTGQEIKLHKQNISENLEQLYNSKYYIKYGGRKTRGNGAVEAISSGALVIMNPDEIIYKEILPNETQCKTLEEIIELVIKLENDSDEYDRLLKLQKKIVDFYFYERPLYNLRKMLNLKRIKKNQRFYFFKPSYWKEFFC